MHKLTRDNLSADNKDIIALVSDIGGLSRRELELLTKRTLRAVANSLMQLRKLKLIHIGRYDRQPKGVAGNHIPIYFEGEGPNVKRPQRLTRKETCKNYRERNKTTISARRYPKAYAEVGVWRGLMA
jgi:hypothetical protein